MLSDLQPFGAPDCESDLTVLGEDGYGEYYFYSTHFNQRSLDPKVYLIVGRRGSGKTALTRFFTFQNILRNVIEINIDEPLSFHEVMSKIAERESFNRDLQIPRLAKIWEYVVWSAIFHNLRSKDLRIETACAFDGEGGISKIIRLLLQSLLEKYWGADENLSDEIDKLFHNISFQKAKDVVLEISKKNPLIVSLDTLEKYSIKDERLMTTTAALVEFASKFSRDYSSKNIYVKVLMMGEIFPYLTEEYISNPLKYVRNEIYLHWKPKDLMRMICWRFFQYLKANKLQKLRTGDIDWERYRDVRDKIWRPYFGEYIINDNGIQERTFPYVLRHTQLRPRQLTVICNSIANRAADSGNFPNFSSSDIILGIKDAEESLADEVFNSYSYIYPNPARISDALSGISQIFQAKELDRRAPQTSSQWLDEYSPYRFRQFVAELGIVGRVRQQGRNIDIMGIVEADFEYAKKGRIPLSTDDLCAIHPMFYTKLNVNVKKKLCVYPFPTHEESRDLDYKI